MRLLIRITNMLRIDNCTKNDIKLKKEINIAQFNNESYKDLEERKDEILEDLGYPITQSYFRACDFTKLRYVTSKSIKNYCRGR